MNTNKNKEIYIGFFDCLHKGHLRILKNKKIPIVTFNYIPKKTKAIYPLRHRLNDLKTIGFKKIYVYEIDKNNMTGKEFINIHLINNGISQITVGEDFKIGKDQINVKEIKKYINVNVIKRTNISTTNIKELLVKGEIHKVNKQICFNYNISGTVIKGKQLGRKLGYKTANIITEYNMYLKNGVYLTQTYINKKTYRSITFIGKSETIDGSIFSIETHIIDFDRNIYGKEIKIEFIKFLDNVKKFNNLDELKKHIKKLVEKSKKIVI